MERVVYILALVSVIKACTQVPCMDDSCRRYCNKKGLDGECLRDGYYYYSQQCVCKDFVTTTTTTTEPIPTCPDWHQVIFDIPITCVNSYCNEQCNKRNFDSGFCANNMLCRCIGSYWNDEFTKPYK